MEVRRRTVVLAAPDACPWTLNVWAEAAGSCVSPLTAMRITETPTLPPDIVSRWTNITAHQQPGFLLCEKNHLLPFKQRLVRQPIIYSTMHSKWILAYWRYLWIRGKRQIGWSPEVTAEARFWLRLLSCVVFPGETCQWMHLDCRTPPFWQVEQTVW